MSPLSQEGLEAMLKSPNTPPLVVIYFTAKWCAPCKRVNLHRVTQYRKDIVWYVCDVDENNYSLGYCGGRQIPAWLAIVNGKAHLPIAQISDDLAVCTWLSKLPVYGVPPLTALAGTGQSSPSQKK